MGLIASKSKDKAASSQNQSVTIACADLLNWFVNFNDFAWSIYENLALRTKSTLASRVVSTSQNNTLVSYDAGVQIAQVYLLDLLVHHESFRRQHAVFVFDLLEALAFLIAAPCVNIAGIRQSSCVITTASEFYDVLAPQTLHKQRCLSKLHFPIVNSQLTVMVIAVTKNLSASSQKSRVVSSTANVCYDNIEA